MSTLLTKPWRPGRRRRRGRPPCRWGCAATAYPAARPARAPRPRGPDRTAPSPARRVARPRGHPQVGHALGAQIRGHDRFVGLPPPRRARATSSPRGVDAAGCRPRRRRPRRDRRGRRRARPRRPRPSRPSVTGGRRSRPTAAAASAASRPSESELPTIATRCPAAAAGRPAAGRRRTALQGVHPDHPGLPEHGVDRVLRAPRCRARRGPAARPGWTARLDRDDRLGSETGGPAGRTCGGCRSTPGRAGRPGGGVLLPVLHHVVARHVRPVARRRTSTGRGRGCCRLEDRRSEGAGLGEEPDGAACWHDRREAWR